MFHKEATEPRIPSGYVEVTTLKVAVTTMNWLTYGVSVSQVTTIFYVWCHNPVLSAWVTYYLVRNTTSATRETATVYSSGAPYHTRCFWWGSCCAIFSFLCNNPFAFFICPSSMYGFWLSLSYLWTLLWIHEKITTKTFAIVMFYSK
jgi:hypothetical protein